MTRLLAGGPLHFSPPFVSSEAEIAAPWPTASRLSCAEQSKDATNGAGDDPDRPGKLTGGTVPTFRGNLQPYGGIKDSGNTREGPAFAIYELTEERFVTLQG